MKTINLKIKKTTNSGQPIDPEYAKKWEYFARVFNEGIPYITGKVKKPRRTPEKQAIKLRGRVYEIIGPFWHKYDFQGNITWKRSFELHAEIREEGMEGLRFFKVVPASFDNRAHFYKLYYAATGEIPDEDAEDFTFTPADVTTRDVYLVIKRGGNRKEGDNKRGGFYSELQTFEPYDLDVEADDVQEDAWKEVPNEGREKMDAEQNRVAEVEADNSDTDVEEETDEGARF
jgi:hypothetical protein